MGQSRFLLICRDIDQDEGGRDPFEGVVEVLNILVVRWWEVLLERVLGRDSGVERVGNKNLDPGCRDVVKWSKIVC